MRLVNTLSDRQSIGKLSILRHNTIDIGQMTMTSLVLRCTTSTKMYYIKIESALYVASGYTVGMTDESNRS
jgi:hypothetical protein